MATPGRTQKQIAERYKGNLGYYKRKHPWRVARFIASSVALVGGVAAIIVYQKMIFQRRASEEFFSTGKISSHHAKFEQDCAQCHEKTAVMGNDFSLAKFKSVIQDRFHHGIDFSAIDHKCQQCHEQNPPFGTAKKYDLHEPNVVENRSCSICHVEHLGPGPMKPVADLHCASCHNDRGIMEASAQKGATLPPAAFHLRPHPPQQIVFEMPRPARGYTEVFDSFAGAHPEFQLVREKARDPDNNALRFSHATHFAKRTVQDNGRMIESCNYCHKPDPEGRFYQRITFEANCKQCHGLKFDKYNPRFEIPHGEVSLVRNFLRTLPAQYADYARLELVRKDGSTTLVPRTKDMIVTDRERVRDSDLPIFVAQQIKLLRAQFGGDGLALERDVFFETSPYKAQRENPDARTRANFVGCAYCHQVKAVTDAAPIVTKPIQVDRWMPQTQFNHAKHASVKCDKCHQAEQSSETSDVLMPAKANCVTCHSPQGKVASDCITCHTYHAPAQTVMVDVRVTKDTTLKDMMRGHR